MIKDGRYQTGSFTLPGEAGYEELTLRLAKKWGADVIRDSDGTNLSEDIMDAGYGIYSTLCIIRADNEWAKANMDKLQQNFLMSFPKIADGNTITIDLLEGYFRQQFVVNSGEESRKYWQVYDRTTDETIDPQNWTYDESNGTVTITNSIAFHKYTVNFLAIRIWEEISMYNHITNDWGDREHLMAVEPRYPQTQQHMLCWLEKWLIEHPATTVVRFTSMFYNFAWFWGDDPNNRSLLSDWSSYDFTVNPLALKQFEEKYGYAMTSEDFVHGGLYNSTHNSPTAKYRDWMDFINEFVVEFGRKCVDLVHQYGKQAYVFYDDSWIGVEPYGERFKDFGFDGLIKCVFSGFEARKCAGVTGVDTHELRMHPYLFPTGLKGEPTFAPGGDPTSDCKRFWANIRRALLRKPVDRIGLGGYLHLVEPFPDFQDYVEFMAKEFRMLRDLHVSGQPYQLPGKVAILTAWGSLRSWICSGHLHEHPEVDLTNVLESLSGLPFDVCFLSFDDIRENGIPEDVRVVINAGGIDTAWSGGFQWEDARVVAAITEYVANGGGLIGINQPSAARYSSQFFQLSHILGVDQDTGNGIILGKYRYHLTEDHFITEGINLPDIKIVEGIHTLGKDTDVLAENNGTPILTTNFFREGRGAYLSGHRFSAESTRLLYRMICWCGGYEAQAALWTCDDCHTECAYYEEESKLVVINNSENEVITSVHTPSGQIEVKLEPHGIDVIDYNNKDN